MKSVGVFAPSCATGELAMTAIHVPGLLTFTIAILVFFAGAGLNRLIEPLRRWNIPEPVTGGLLAAAGDAAGLCRARR